jgi:hypothetical protein
METITRKGDTGQSWLPGSAAQIAASRFLGITSSEETEITAGTTQSTIAPADPERVVLSIVNLSSGVAYVALSPAVSATRGIALAANGGSITITADDDGELVTRAWYALATLASSPLYRIVVRRHTAVP